MTRHDNPGDEGYYTVRQAAEKLGVTRQRVRQLCVDKKLKAIKRDGAWLVYRSAVQERFAIKPPKVKLGEVVALGEQRRLIDKLTRGNRELAVWLDRTRTSEAGLRRKMEESIQLLKRLRRELGAERERLVSERKRAEALSLALEERDARIDKLERELRDGSSEPFGSRAPRLLKDPVDDWESC